MGPSCKACHYAAKKSSNWVFVIPSKSDTKTKISFKWKVRHRQRESFDVSIFVGSGSLIPVISKWKPDFILGDFNKVTHRADRYPPRQRVLRMNGQLGTLYHLLTMRRYSQASTQDTKLIREKGNSL